MSEAVWGREEVRWSVNSTISHDLSDNHVEFSYQQKVIELRLSSCTTTYTWVYCSAYMLSQFRLSICLTHGWICQKAIKLGSCNFQHTVLAPSLYRCGLFHPEICSGHQTMVGWGKRAIFQLHASVSRKRYKIQWKLQLLTNGNGHMAAIVFKYLN